MCGYVWGKTNLKIEIPIKNEKDRQTYRARIGRSQQRIYCAGVQCWQRAEHSRFHGASPKSSSWSKNRVDLGFASYHKAEEMKELLAAINAGKDAMQWQVRCILFAPNAPEQNPVEDVWLQTKNFI